MDAYPYTIALVSNNKTIRHRAALSQTIPVKRCLYRICIFSNIGHLKNSIILDSSKPDIIVLDVNQDSLTYLNFGLVPITFLGVPCSIIVANKAMSDFLLSFPIPFEDMPHSEQNFYDYFMNELDNLNNKKTLANI